MFDEDQDHEQDETDGLTFVGELNNIAYMIGAPIFLIEMFFTGAQHGDPLCVEGRQFSIPLCDEWLCIPDVLASYGIRTYGVGVDYKCLFFSVDQADAAWTQAILEDNGIPILEPGEDIWRA